MTFVELFFDLVFVFSVTQVVGLLHDGITLEAIGRAILVFWLVWWGWTQFTWALNAADTTNPLVELGTLGATAVAFFMAVAVPDAFGSAPLAFAVPYVLVRGIGLGLYVVVAARNEGQLEPVRRFSILSLGGLLAVVLGAVAGGSAQYALWGLGIVLDIIATSVGGQSENWDLHPEHFGERHGLFVIIALGETLIVAAGGVAGAERTGELVAVSIMAVALTCALWWTYFTRAKPILDDALDALRGARQSALGRDAFSLLHFPMVCGVIAYAAAIEAAVAHPADPLGVESRLALAVGVVLFVGGMALALWRATGRLPVLRTSMTVATAVAVAVVGGVSPIVTLALALAGVAAVAFLEERHWSTA